METAHIPAWAAPAAREVADCLWIARACAAESAPGSRFEQIAAVADWAATEPARDDAVGLLMASDGAAWDTVAWLLGRAPAPLRLPRRNPDGTLLTEQQLTDEYLAGTTGLPEQRRDAEQRARKDAASNRRLAALVPH
jgi:hypothetical protein